MPRKFKVSDFQKAVIIAQADVEINEETHDLPAIFERLFPSESVVTTIEAVALLIRWQALNKTGEWDLNQIEDCKYLAKKHFLIA